jgi:hypothetical protein
MNIYEYNSSTINAYSQEDSGLLTESSWEVVDCGNLENTDIKEDLYTIDCNETLTPFGGVKVSGGNTKYKKTNSVFKKYLDLNSRSIVFYGIVLRWVGFSVIFQLSNDAKRDVIPDVSGGGRS